MLCRLLTSLLVLPLLVSFTAAQAGGPPPRPGFVLVDDMWLPSEVVYGDGYFHATAWPGGNVPYLIHPSVPSDLRGRLRLAMDDLEAVAGVDFRPRNGEADYLRIDYVSTMGGAANSAVGVIGGRQLLRAGPNVSKTTFIHELMHTLGFLHEQSRPDRDTYVTINWGNISQTQCSGSSCDHNFQIMSGGTQYGPYDFRSVMHYRQFTWSICGDPPGPPAGGCPSSLTTIDCKPAYSQFQAVMGTGRNMSFGDANGLISRYGSTTVVPTVNGVYPGALTLGSGNATIVLYGTNFYEGSKDGNGVLGTQVKVNGAFVPPANVRFQSPTTLEVDIPPYYLINPGCLQVSADNSYGGTSNSWSLGVLAGAPSAGLWTGGAVNSYMGTAVTSLGDVDGDLHDDLLLGAPGTPLGNQPDAGEVRCVSGRTGATLWSRMGIASQQLGAAVANAGDVNGDGVADALVGAPGYPPFSTNPTWGFAYLFSGADGTQILPYTRFVMGDRLGTAVANAGDVNGDGVPDQIIGIPGADQAKVYSGATGASIRTLTGPSGSGFGSAVAGGFDMGTDGVPDQAVGAPLYLSSRGRVYLFSGASGSNFDTKQGDASGDSFGSSLAMMVSPDGRNGGAIVIGAPRASSRRGYVRLFGPYQGPFTTGSNWPLIATLDGAGSSDLFGYSVGSAGDLNQDGHLDVIVGAPETSSTTGYVNVYDGRSMTLLESVRGLANGDRFGWSVGAAGDTNADGVPDMVAGARVGGLGCNAEGYARTWHPIVPPEPEKLLITEVHWGARAGIEVTNFGPTSVNLVRMRVRWFDGTMHESAPVSSLVVPSGASCLLMEQGGLVACGVGGCTAANYYSEAPPATPYQIVLPSIATAGQAFAVGLVDSEGVVIDEVRVRGTGPLTPQVLPGTGGTFRGVAYRSAATVSVERIWGLDSNSGGDWTAETVRGFGLESRSSGPRGVDPIPVPRVLVNETDDSPDYIELKNDSGGRVDLRNWYLLASARQDQAHGMITPWPMRSLSLVNDAFVVIGDGATAPAELPSWVPYAALSAVSGGNIPWTSEEYDCALYDAYGRQVDLVRTSGHDDLRVHNHPRAPGPPRAFTGGAYRSDTGEGSVGRTLLNTDSDDGSDWVPLYTRSMGTENPLSSYGGPRGLGGGLDVRLNGTPEGRGLTVIIDAGPAFAGRSWSFLLSSGHLHGEGPFFGLGPEALTTWLQLQGHPLWTGVLDARGSARIDFDAGSLPAGLSTDDIFIVQDATGGLLLRTPVIEWDS